MDIIVVESPKKSRHIQQMLGPKFLVIPTLGHVKNLPAKELAIDVNSGFEPKYQLERGKGEILRRIKEMGEEAETIVLATDPDREGEGIAYHIWTSLPMKLQKKCKRAEFHAITSEGVKKGLNNIRAIDMNMAMAQQARRVMDRLTGYMVSPMLWRRIKGQQGLSAGRVQSAALKIIYDREMAITQFVEEEFWSIRGRFCAPLEPSFYADLQAMNGIPLAQEPIRDKKQVEIVLDLLSRSRFKICALTRADKNYAPPDPFVTSTLLKAASSHLGFSPKKTMQIAQELFEGIGGVFHEGLITYMRTDSPRVDPSAAQMAAAWVESTYGMAYVRPPSSTYKVKENVQDAHECIRPTQILRDVQKLKSQLTDDQFSLYDLILQRFLISQMADSVHDEISTEIIGQSGDEKSLFHGFSSRVKFPGWKVFNKNGYEEKYQEALEQLEIEEVVVAQGFEEKQHRTRPPAAYTEASIIETLERLGIGRPSTYASIIETLVDRKYVDRKKHLAITEVGRLVVNALEDAFPQILDAEFTSIMEKELDKIATNETNWTEPVEDLYLEIMRSSEL